MKKACAGYRETYDENSKTSSVQNSLGLYFKKLKPVQYLQKGPHKATRSTESHQVSTEFARVSTKYPQFSPPSIHLRRFNFDRTDDPAPSSSEFIK